jgi:hypothetical protein
MDIVITRDYFWTLEDVVITDLIHIDLVQHALTTTMHPTTLLLKTRRNPTQSKLHEMILIP